MSDYRTKVGDVLFDWSRTTAGNHATGERVVWAVLRAEDLGRFTDGANWRGGSSAERCALHGGHPRRENGR